MIGVILRLRGCSHITVSYVFLLQLHFYFTTLYLVSVQTIDMIRYTKYIGYRTIVALAKDNEIDTVYVRFADENEDRMYDCAKPTDMNILKEIIAFRHPLIIGWRVHHHHREEKNLAAAKAFDENDDTSSFGEDDDMY